MCKNEHEQSEVIAHLLTVSKSLERISDHAKNIAQSIVFMVEGQDLRHRGLQDKADAPDLPSLDEYSTGESFGQET
jgi:phosphate transport system protein